MYIHQDHTALCIHQVAYREPLQMDPGGRQDRTSKTYKEILRVPVGLIRGSPGGPIGHLEERRVSPVKLP